MNLLYLKRKVKPIIIVIFASLACFSFISKDSSSENDFLEICKKSDAYFIHNYTDIAFTKNWSGSYNKTVSIVTKLVVNNSIGVDKYAYLDLSEFVSNNIKKIDVKTLKVNGSVIELDSSLVFPKKARNEDFGAIHYPIPGVEPGDTISTSYTYSENLRKYEMNGFGYLYSELPSLTTEFTIRSTPSLTVMYKQYNEFPDPEVVTNKNLIYCQFKMNNVIGLKPNEYTCIPCELPYMYYSLDTENSELTTWKDVYNEEFNFITQPLSIDSNNSTYYNRWKRRVLGEAKDSSKYHQFKKLHKYILDEFDVEDLEGSEIVKSDGYFLKQNRFDPLSIRRMYRRMLEDLEIDYWAVFARSKRAGAIDPDYIRKGEFDHIFFAYRDDNNRMNLLYPHDTQYKYQINEIPTSLYNTQAIMAKPILSDKEKKKNRFIDLDLELAEADSVSINLVKLPSPSADHNKVNQLIYSKVDLVNKKTPLKYRFSVSGGMFTELQAFFTLLENNKEMSDLYDAVWEVEGDKEAIVIDSITDYSFKEVNPFSYTMSATGSLKEVISFLNDDLVSISLEHILDHNQVESEDGTLDFNYYLDFGYTDQFMAIFSFPSDIEILGIDDYNESIKNDTGEYSFNLKHIGGNEVTLQSIYKINSDIIPKDDLSNLEAINQLTNKIKNKRLVIKIKK
ncbi:hypothetical protein [Winogradskyella sp. A3E31]|uniref:hypothetical protein n=1 Tax=Winogradskyella sp. A3E31 TaxID=3349637 RepID=UPI00398AA635